MWFPRVQGANLERRVFTLPDDFEGTYNLALIAFRREQQFDIDTWVPTAKALAQRLGEFRYYELPTISRRLPFGRQWLDDAMRAGIPDRAAREATITLYIDKAAFRHSLDLPTEATIYALLVTRDGQVLWFSEGPWTAEKGEDLEHTLQELSNVDRDAQASAADGRGGDARRPSRTFRWRPTGRGGPASAACSPDERQGQGKLDGKIAVVTGGTRGLGLAIAEAFAREGASVMLCGRTPTTVERAVEALRQHGEKVSGIVADVGDLADMRRVAQHTERTFGRIDVWVNNAGVAGVYGPTAALDPAVVEHGVRTNILGVYYGSLVAIQQFQSQGGAGKLINLLGRGDRKPVPLQNAYAPTKAWVRSFTTALAREYGDTGISVYMLNPGLMETDMMRHVVVVRGFEDKVKALGTVMRLWANPPAVPAEVGVWLASSATDGRTGVEKHVLTAFRVIAGLVSELLLRVLRRPVPEVALDIHIVEPYSVMGRQMVEA